MWGIVVTVWRWGYRAGQGARRVRDRSSAPGIPRVLFSHREAPEEKELWSSGSDGRAGEWGSNLDVCT